MDVIKANYYGIITLNKNERVKDLIPRRAKLFDDYINRRNQLNHEINQFNLNNLHKIIIPTRKVYPVYEDPILKLRKTRAVTSQRRPKA